MAIGSPWRTACGPVSERLLWDPGSPERDEPDADSRGFSSSGPCSIGAPGVGCPFGPMFGSGPAARSPGMRMKCDRGRESARSARPSPLYSFLINALPLWHRSAGTRIYGSPKSAPLTNAQHVHLPPARARDAQRPVGLRHIILAEILARQPGYGCLPGPIPS